MRTYKRGAEHHCAVLSADDVRMMRALFDERTRAQETMRRVSDRAIADKFEVSVCLVKQIRSGARYA